MQKTQAIIEFGEQLALELVKAGRERNMTARELTVGVVVAERLLQNVLFPDNAVCARNAILEGHATFDAVATSLVEN